MIFIKDKKSKLTKNISFILISFFISINDSFSKNHSDIRELDAFLTNISQKHKFKKKDLENLFNQTKNLNKTVNLIKRASDPNLKSWPKYSKRFIDSSRIRQGVKFWKKYQNQLFYANKMYGVPEEIIVSIIGIETFYGRNTGNTRVLDALFTLGFNYPNAPNKNSRMSYFRKEIEQFLLFSRENNFNPLNIFGSYAGAIGYPQFMPGSIRLYAVDFDEDGKIDLQNSPVDAIGSVARFLSKHGWEKKIPYVFPAKLSKNPNAQWKKILDKSLEANYGYKDCVKIGIYPSKETPKALNYGLISLRKNKNKNLYWLATKNFFAITKYNRSFYYAMTVIELSKEIKKKMTN
tara:strand:+ start:1406 stop:2452 length:1047 start_codon:yes stop_codon:yes gene_type:complete